jgi:glycine oxidase
MVDLIVIGGGVIGLSLAYEMSQRGANVTVVDLPQSGQASWAGAGILVPTNEQTAIHPLEKLRGMSSRLHAQWARQLNAETGIDNGYLECGGVYIARTAGEVAALRGVVEDWIDFEIEHKLLSVQQLAEYIPPLSDLEASLRPRTAVWVANESQIENPAHMEALRHACRHRGVELIPECHRVKLSFEPERIAAVQVDGDSLQANSYCIAAGAWSERLLDPLGFRMSMLPIRGQIVLFKLDHRIFEPVIYEGSRYIVPRKDGHVLVGATVEEAGFDASTTPSDINDLVAFAHSLIPALNESTFETCWAGLRPATFDGFPYLGRLPELSNGFVSTGHFKAGLHLSTGSAVVMADLIEGKPATVDLSPFDPARVSPTQTGSRC